MVEYIVDLKHQLTVSEMSTFSCYGGCPSNFGRFFFFWKKVTFYRFFFFTLVYPIFLKLIFFLIFYIKMVARDNMSTIVDKLNNYVGHPLCEPM